jgi:hypothetical protein
MINSFYELFSLRSGLTLILFAPTFTTFTTDALHVLPVLAYALSPFSSDLCHMIAITTYGFAPAGSNPCHMFAVPAHSFTTFASNGTLLFGSHGCKSTIGSSLLFFFSSFHLILHLIPATELKNTMPHDYQRVCVETLKQNCGVVDYGQR